MKAKVLQDAYLIQNKSVQLIDDCDNLRKLVDQVTKESPVFQSILNYALKFSLMMSAKHSDQMDSKTSIGFDIVAYFNIFFNKKSQAWAHPNPG